MTRKIVKIENRPNLFAAHTQQPAELPDRLRAQAQFLARRFRLPPLRAELIAGLAFQTEART